VNTFDVHDLDSCDQVVYDNLPQEIFRGGVSNFSSSFIIAHLLGLDHVGHSRSTIDDPMMDVKMKEISKFLEQVFEEADEETVFLVTGDHGMRGDGNHGGTSIDEV
jgi:predicted AlkP superfamily pyrophosphatase or phosphodiesterase